MFRKLVIAVFAVCFLTIPVFAARRTSQNAKTSTDSVSLAVDKTAKIYTMSFPIAEADSTDNIYVMYSQTPATGDTNIFFEQSYQRPTTEGEIDSAYCVTDHIDDELADDRWHFATIDTVFGTFGRFKIQGEGSNPATTILTIKVFR